MKLAKKISKGIALCAALAIMGAMGGVITSCSNGSEEEYQPNIKTISDVEDVTFTATKESVGEENTNIVFTYDRSANGAKEKIAINDCNIEVLFNGEKLKTINKLDFALNEYGDFMGDNATQYQCKISIGKKISPNDIVKVVFTSKTGDVRGEGAESAKIYTLTVSLIDNDEQAGDDGWYNELVENEYQKLFPNGDVGGDNDDGTGAGTGAGTGTGTGTGAGAGTGTGIGTGGGNGEGNGDNNEEEKEPVTPPAEDKETVIYKLDFSGEKAPENHYCDEKKFEANVGAKIEGAWNNFSIVPKNDASALKDATHIRVTFKCSSDAAFADGDVDNNKFMVGLYKDGGEDKNYAETNVRWTCFLNGNKDDFPKDFTLVEKKINWEQKYESDGTTKMPLADFECTSNFRIWDCNFVTGTLIVQSIEFIKK